MTTRRIAAQQPLPVRTRVMCGAYALEIWSGGFCRFDSQPTNHSHRHDTYHELCLVTAGRGEFRHGEKLFALETGNVFFSELATAHEISSHRTRDLHIYFLCLSVAALGASPATDASGAIVSRFVASHRLCTPTKGTLLPYLQLLCSTDTSPVGAYRREQAARMFVLEALSSLALGPDRPVSVPTAPDTMRLAIDHIENNITRPLSVRELSERCFCSPRHLRRLFREHTGRGVLSSVNERRMKLAAQQLLMRFPVGQVATACGIASPAHFSRLFARYHGMSPKRYQTRFAPAATLPKTEFERDR